MQRTRSILTAILLLCTTTYLYHSHYSHSLPIPLSRPEPHVLKTLPPANSTLGFGTIIAVSPTHSPRRASLLWAANLTSISIEIPPFPEWTTSDVEKFKAKEGSKISIGSAKAWLSHLNALRWFLFTTTHDTALILEDDTDFSLFLRKTQIPLLASSLRGLLNSSTDDTYWPPSSQSNSQWHTIYPGHCDDLPSQAYLSAPHLTYHDPSTPPPPLLHPDTSLFLSSLNVPSQTRLVHRAYWPFCTFAYAVTRASATLILESFSTEPRGGSSAFDVALLGACRDWGWGCWSVAPELFHHVVGDSEIGRADRYGEDEEVLGERKWSTRGTWNLACGARHAQLWVGEEDAWMRAEMKRVVERAVERGECPVHGLREEGAWNGCEWGECGAQS